MEGGYASRLQRVSGFPEKIAYFLRSFTLFSGSFGYGKEAKIVPQFLKISPTNKHIQILHTGFDGCFSWDVFGKFMFFRISGISSGNPEK